MEGSEEQKRLDSGDFGVFPPDRPRADSVKSMYDFVHYNAYPYISDSE
jgi:hypothetical protein